ncbi:MAG: two-component system, NtrC family, response regulator AtoC [Thermoplasmata archaeon]|nr:two-component system, NtrC family, response regulator AtoC [Thermoplasmata archaeon]
MDDSPTIRLGLAAAIRQAARGATDIVEATDAKSALTSFREKKPDAVFLDIMLGSGESGLDVLRQMLEIQPNARIILVTGLPANDPKVVDGVSSGAFAFLPKPARTDSIRKILNDMETEAGRFGRIR